MDLNLARICHMYYEKRMTQQEIATQLGCSRIQISRLLQQARQDGVVTISIKYDGFFPELETALAKKFASIKFLVVDSFGGDVESLRQAIGIAGGAYVSRTCQPGQVISVGWGTTMRDFADNFPLEAKKCHVTPMVGGQNSMCLEYHANYVAATVAERMEGTSANLLAPAVAGTIQERDAFVSSVLVSQVLSRAADSAMAVFSIGAPFAPHSTISDVGYFTDADLQLLKDVEASCDVISTAFFNANGDPVAESLTRRLVGLTEKQLRKIPQKVCLAGGKEKAGAIQIALMAGFIDVLVTDEDVAKLLLAG